MSVNITTVKAGDLIRLKNNRLQYIVLSTNVTGVTYLSELDESQYSVRFAFWRSVEIPEPPKAKPGVFYQNPSDDYARAPAGSPYVGLASGEVLKRIHNKVMPFDPHTMIEVV